MAFVNRPAAFSDASLRPILAAVREIAREEGLPMESLAEQAHLPAAILMGPRADAGMDWRATEALALAAGLNLEVLAEPRTLAGHTSPLADPQFKLAWSNPDAPVTALIANAIERGSFDLILLAVREHGIGLVAEVLCLMTEEGETHLDTLKFAERALRNIVIGAAHAGHAAGH